MTEKAVYGKIINNGMKRELEYNCDKGGIF